MCPPAPSPLRVSSPCPRAPPRRARSAPCCRASQRPLVVSFRRFFVVPVLLSRCARPAACVRLPVQRCAIVPPVRVPITPRCAPPLCLQCADSSRAEPGLHLVLVSGLLLVVEPHQPLAVEPHQPLVFEPHQPICRRARSAPRHALWGAIAAGAGGAVCAFGLGVGGRIDSRLWERLGWGCDPAVASLRPGRGAWVSGAL